MKLTDEQLVAFGAQFMRAKRICRQCGAMTFQPDGEIRTLPALQPGDDSKPYPVIAVRCTNCNHVLLLAATINEEPLVRSDSSGN